MKKILSIDGGGIRGIIPALVLAEIERKTGRPIAELFDLIIGTSTGGLLALGFGKRSQAGGAQYSARELSELYEKRGAEIFSRSLWRRMPGYNITDEKYSHEGLETVLEEYFGDDRLGQLSPNIVVTAYDLHQRDPLFLKSWNTAHRDIRVRDAARATSAAPTYFEPLPLQVCENDCALVDGGVFINNPAVSGYAEARRLFPEEEAFFVLSLGTGQMTRKIPYQDAKDWGQAAWVIPLLSCMFDGVSDAADYQMRQILPEGSYFRLQANLGKRGDPLRANDDMDDASERNIRDLQALAVHLIHSHAEELKAICAALTAGGEHAQARRRPDAA
ncbi:patatin-like phospholipase family protein [Pseudomonas sp. CAU 1711]|uniref:patatin-like phospholipase family protein n=1 Tax=Pseudomonas sp. CAU 1711 TaxID=3140356 RepID=UPI0032616843